MSRKILISGSIAYDNLMVFEGRFKDHILPDQLYRLSVSFLTPQLKREFGGCAANIAYNLAGLGGEPIILGAVGCDGSDYLARLRALNINVDHVLSLNEAYTSQCFITTDLDDNQITAFHPGAMSQAHRVAVADAPPAAFGIIAPNGRDAMIEHARAFRDQGIPFIFDPGQGLPLFDGPTLRQMIKGAAAITVNDYEAQLLANKLDCRDSDLQRLVPTLIVTRGAEGSEVYVEGMATQVPAATVSSAVDPTGCGDAYRGGLLFGLAQGWSWVDCARLGSVMGAIKIEQHGPQNHMIDYAEIERRYQQTFNEALPS